MLPHVAQRFVITFGVGVWILVGIYASDKFARSMCRRSDIPADVDYSRSYSVTGGMTGSEKTCRRRRQYRTIRIAPTTDVPGCVRVAWNPSFA